MKETIRIVAEIDNNDRYLCGPKLSVIVYVGNQRFTYNHGLPVPIIDSYFDMIWEDLGNSLKIAMKEGKKDGDV